MQKPAFRNCAVALLLALAFALPVVADDLAGTWGVSGHHPSKGAYTGTAVFAPTAGDASRWGIEWSVKFKGDGSTGTWSGTGTLAGKTLRTACEFGGSGVVDRLGGGWEAGSTLTGVYRLRFSGTVFSGKWSTSGDAPVRGSETLRRARGLRIDRVEPAVLNRQPGTVALHVVGSGFPQGLEADEVRVVDPEIATQKIVAVAADGTSIDLEVTVSASISLGGKTLAVKDVKKEKALHFLELDLRTDSDRNGTVDAADEKIEEATPGAAALGGADASKDFLPVRLGGYLSPNLPGKLLVKWEGSGSVRLYDGEQREVLTPAKTEGELALALVASDSPVLRLVGVKGGTGFLTVRFEGQGFTLEDRARVQIVEELAYYFLWTYLGKEYTYLDNELKRMSAVFDALKRQGFVLYEDGAGYDQSKIDKAFEKAEVLKNPKRLIVDRNGTRADWEKYFARRTVRGMFWAGHGFMEPFIGCPDSELLKPESRVWSAAPGDPQNNETRCWVREWSERVKSQNVQPLDFAIMHSCATGGFGSDYGHEPWEYCNPATKARVQAKFGRLPPLAELTEVSYNTLQPHVKHLVTYSGSAYFGLWDMDLNVLIRSITATR